MKATAFSNELGRIKRWRRLSKRRQRTPRPGPGQLNPGFRKDAKAEYQTGVRMLVKQNGFTGEAHIFDGREWKKLPNGW